MAQYHEEEYENVRYCVISDAFHPGCHKLDQMNAEKLLPNEQLNTQYICVWCRYSTDQYRSMKCHHGTTKHINNAKDEVIDGEVNTGDHRVKHLLEILKDNYERKIFNNAAKNRARARRIG